jgi:SNF2 family DNA or RNA helicase
MNTQGFSKAENELLAGWLRWKWEVNARVIKLGRYHALYLNHETAVKFLELLPGSFPSVEYKFPNKPVLKDLNGIPNRGLVKDSIVNITFWKRATQKCVDYVYDLEVEGNHNYIANGTLVSNCTAFKNNRTKTWQVCRELSDRANRCYGMTATLLKNNLIEGFSIYKCIHPNVFSTKTKFLDTFCVTRMQPVAGGRKIPIVVGYRNLELFRMRIDPFFLGRPKHLISDELPTLVTREVPVKLSVAENTKYEEALSGVLSLGDGEVRNYEEHKRLVALIYCQQTVDSLSLLRYKEGDVIDIDMFCEEQVKVETLSSKEQALMDLLTEEFDNEKVIVYTRFASLIPRLQTLCEEAGILSTAITGKVTDTKKNPARQKAMEAFQDLNSKVRVIFISDAGSEAINLQAAEVLIAYNAPWSWGNYVQLLGRPIRIGSPHQHVIAIHLVAERPSKKYKTIDHYALEILHRKKNLIDKVLGESAVGALDFESEGSFTFELMKSLRKSGVE